MYYWDFGVHRLQIYIYFRTHFNIIYYEYCAHTHILFAGYLYLGIYRTRADTRYHIIRVHYVIARTAGRKEDFYGKLHEQRHSTNASYLYPCK